MKSILLGALVLAGCGYAGKFKDQPVVWQVDDQHDIAEPEARDFLLIPFAADVELLGRVPRVLSVPDHEPAWNTNALDEVPNSSWFTNRIGMRAVSPAEAARGEAGSGPPVPPLRISGGKVGGGNPGFLVEDARGKRYLVKFDTKENPELQTSAGVIVNKIFWTLGYFVPNDSVFSLATEHLAIEPGAKTKDELGNERPIVWEDVRAVLETSPPPHEGRYRAFASELLEGEPKGGFAASGTRDDDANDTIPHEHRREVRAIRVFAAWVNHSDMKEDNSLDLYVKENGRRFLRHYLLDFGEALGGHPAEKGRFEDGFEHYWDWERQPRALVSFGLWKRPWEDVKNTPWPSIGPFSAEPFDPTYWREAYPYWPFFETDAVDAYWGAKLVMRFTDEMLEAIVATGQLSDPAAARHLVRTLALRRDKIGRVYFDAVTPLDEFRTRGRDLCMVDLAVRHRFVPPREVEAVSDGGDVLRRFAERSDGSVCVGMPAEERYAIHRLRVRAPDGSERPPVAVHVVGGKNARLIGVIRGQ